MQKICPHCGSIQVNISKRRRLFDWFFRLFGYLPYRCQICSTRFYDTE